jgi:hypothetical protein
MDLSPQVLELIKQVYAANMSLATTDDGQRQLAKMVAEQVVFSTGDTNWGVKSAAPGRPQGPSQIAYNSTSGQLLCWRWLDGPNAGKPNGVLDSPIFLDITGQNFIPVGPVNHLQAPTPDAPIPPPQPNSDSKSITDQLITIGADIVNLAHAVSDMREELDAISAKLDRRYTSKIFGATVVTQPEKPEDKK